MNKKGLGQGKLISLFTFQREFLERGRRVKRVLERFHNQQKRERIWAQKSRRILGTNFEKADLYSNTEIEEIFAQQSTA